MSRRAIGSVVKAFGGEVTDAFSPVAEEYGLEGPHERNHILRSLAFAQGPLRYRVYLDLEEYRASCSVELDVEDGLLTAELGSLVRAAGLGPAEQVRTSATTVAAMRKALGSQVGFIRRLHPQLASEGAADLMRKAGARHWLR